MRAVKKLSIQVAAHRLATMTMMIERTELVLAGPVVEVVGGLGVARVVRGVNEMFLPLLLLLFCAVNSVRPKTGFLIFSLARQLRWREHLGGRQRGRCVWTRGR